jgi:hypothetical protein
MPQVDTIFERFIWLEISSQEYQLRAGDRVLGGLCVEDALGSSMTGEIVNSCRWTFRRSGFIRSCIEARAKDDETHSAILKQDWAEQYTVSLPDGKSLTWKRAEAQEGEEWAFVDSDDTSLLIFVSTATDSGYQARIRVPAIDQAVPSLCFLLLLGGYVLISKCREDQLKLAMQAAIPWGPS